MITSLAQYHRELELKVYPIWFIFNKFLSCPEVCWSFTSWTCFPPRTTHQARMPQRCWSMLIIYILNLFPAANNVSSPYTSTIRSLPELALIHAGSNPASNLLSISFPFSIFPHCWETSLLELIKKLHCRNPCCLTLDCDPSQQNGYHLLSRLQPMCWKSLWFIPYWFISINSCPVLS